MVQWFRGEDRIGRIFRFGGEGLGPGGEKSDGGMKQGCFENEGIGCHGGLELIDIGSIFFGIEHSISRYTSTVCYSHRVRVGVSRNTCPPEQGRKGGNVFDW